MHSIVAEYCDLLLSVYLCAVSDLSEVVNGCSLATIPQIEKENSRNPTKLILVSCPLVTVCTATWN